MSDEYEYGPWIDVPEGTEIEIDTRDRWGAVYPGARYRILTPKPRREFVVGKWYCCEDGEWRRLIFSDEEGAWLTCPDDHDEAMRWLHKHSIIDWSVSPRDEAPE